MAGTDFSHLTTDELIKGIKALDLPDYIRSKAYGIDVRETLAQMTEMTIQLGVNMGLSPDDALKWARKLQETVSQSEFDSWVATLLDGGPSIFMNTLNELQTTYPNGASGVALVRETDPAKIYIWNGSVWEDFGAYQGIEVKDGTVTEEKLSFTPLIGLKGKNLFNKKDIETGYFFRNTTGEKIENADYFISEFIPVFPSTNYTNKRSRGIVFYDTDKTFISYIRPTQPNDENLATFETPTNASYVRLDNKITNLNMMQLELGKQSTAYEPYTNFLDIETIKKESIGIEYLKEKPITLSEKNMNLFNNETITPNKNVSWYDGRLIDNESYVVSDYIPVIPNALYSQTAVLTGAWYDINKEFVAGIQFGDTQPLIAPTDAYFIRISVRKSEIDKHVLVKGDELPNTYVGYWAKLGDDLIEKNNFSGNVSTADYARDVIFTPNSIVDLWGDSRTHGSGGTGFDSSVNGGGTQILGGTEGVFTSPNSHSWANSLKGLMSDKYSVTVRNWGEHGRNTNHFINRMETLLNQESNPDLIVFALGTNDRHNMSLEQSENNVRNMISSILANDIKVVLLSMPPTSIAEEAQSEKNFSMYDLDKMFRKLADEFNVGFISGYANSLEYQEKQGLAEDGLLADGLHENDLGHDVVFKETVKALGISYVKEGSR